MWDYLSSKPWGPHVFVLGYAAVLIILLSIALYRGHRRGESFFRTMLYRAVPLLIVWIYAFCLALSPTLFVMMLSWRWVLRLAVVSCVVLAWAAILQKIAPQATGGLPKAGKQQQEEDSDGTP